ncbi:MAG TPA: signal peptide peptidase SppA [Chloroflexi bacterium]|nr:signal peptide peptidase SppA [Chloroflexota bacterium]
MKDNKSILWIFLAFILGFALPVCSCLGSGLVTFAMIGRMASAAPTTDVGVGDAVAVIRLDGAINSTPAQETVFVSEGITPGRVAKLLQQAEFNPNVKALVLRVNSPGGSVVASDEIYHQLRDFEKPIVLWMDAVAASGGYYIACGADYVYAHPDTLTGSIGVISQFINAEELLDEVGVNVTVITSGPRKDMGSLFREMSEEEQELWKTITDEIYQDFVDVVAEARGLPEDTVKDLGDGRVYTGRQALEHNLIDAVGLPDDAIAKAAELGGIELEPGESPRVIELKTTPTFIESLYGFQSRSAIPTLDEVLSWAGAPSVQYRFTGP